MQRPEFVQIFREIIEHPDCTMLDALLYGYIYWLSRLKNERCTASNQTLAELCKSTPSTIANSLTTLEGAGFIVRVFKDGNRRGERVEIMPTLYMRNAPNLGKSLSPVDESTFHPGMKDLSPVGEHNKNNIYILNTGAAPREVRIESEKPEVSLRAFDREAFMQRLAKSSKRFDAVILWYWQRKRLTFENEYQASLQYRRDMKTAAEIAKARFNVDRVERVASYCEANYPEWTLETILKTYLEKQV